MRPDPNALAQAMIRLLGDRVMPGADAAASATVRRVIAILRDTDWSGAQRIAAAEAARLRDLGRALPEIDRAADAEPASDADAAEVIRLRRQLSRAVVALSLRDDWCGDELRREIAAALADCADYGLKQTSAPSARGPAKEE